MSPQQTQRRLDALTDRLATLLKEEPDPLAEMQEQARRLADADLSDFHPNATTTPDQFAETVIAGNPRMWDVVTTMDYPSSLRVIETAGELVSLLLPNNWDHG